jgi:phosphoglycolate phosphatase
MVAGVAEPAPGGLGADPVRLIIFDFDGTLSDSGEWFLTVIDQLAERFRFRTIDRDEIESLRGRSSREVVRYLGIPAWKLPLISRHVRAMVARDVDKIHLFPDTPRLLRTLTEMGFELAIVTSNAEANARAILGPDNAARIRWWECGSGLWGKARKFRRVLKRSGFALHDVLAIGDETRDIEAAKRVGVRSGAVLWGYANRDALARFRPNLLFANVDAILETLGPAQPSATPDPIAAQA